MASIGIDVNGGKYSANTDLYRWKIGAEGKFEKIATLETEQLNTLWEVSKAVFINAGIHGNIKFYLIVDDPRRMRAIQIFKERL